METKYTTPLIGTKPYCPIHPGHTIDFVCTASCCSYRIMCSTCLKNHDIDLVLHRNMARPLNKWHKEYKKISHHFDPQDNYQTIYHLNQMNMTLNKERDQLEEIGKTMDSAFDEAMKKLFVKIRSIKVEMNHLLWRDYMKLYQKFGETVQRFEEFGDKKKFENQIFELMKSELEHYFQKNDLKTYFDGVFSGKYDKIIYNNQLDISEAIKELKFLRKKIEQGFPKFNQVKFDEIWASELDNFETILKRRAESEFFLVSKGDFLNPMSPSFRKEGINPEDSIAGQISCLEKLEGLSSFLIHSLDSNTYITVSEDNRVTLIDSIRNFKKTKEFVIGKNEIAINSSQILKYDRSTLSPLYLVLVGRNEDDPSLELWDCSNNKQVIKHQIEADCASNLLLLKHKKTGEIQQEYHLATTTPDGEILIWNILLHYNEEYLALQGEINQIHKVMVHDNFITSLIVVPITSNIPFSLVISTSMDKSICIWHWEEELVAQKSPNNSKETLFFEKIEDAHKTRVNCVIQIHEKEDFSDLQLFATGAGDGSVTVWNISTKEKVTTWNNSQKAVSSMEYLKEDRVACSANDVKMKIYNIFVWNWKTSNLLLVLREHDSRIQKIIAFNKALFATSDQNRIIKIWKFET